MKQYISLSGKSPPPHRNGPSPIPTHRHTKSEEALIPSPEFKELQSLLGSVPVSMEVMEEKGLLPVYFPIFKRVLSSHESGGIPMLIEQGIAAALSTRCSNSYCFVGHAMYLTSQGISQEELEDIIQRLCFPSRIPDSEKWSRVLRWAFLFGNSSMGVPSDKQEADMTVRNLLNEKEMNQLFNLIIANTVLNRLAEYYPDRVTVENDIPEGETGEQFRMAIPNLVAFYHKVSKSENEKRPVVTMCMHCKDIRDSTGRWRALETSIAALDRSSMFSHSICDNCHQKYHAQAV